MGIPTLDYEVYWRLAKGELNIGVFHLSWDFTDGMIKENFIEMKRRESQGFWIRKNGRLIMPSCGIY